MQTDSLTYGFSLLVEHKSSATAVRRLYHTPYCPCCPQRQLSAAFFTTCHIVPAVLSDSSPPPSLPHVILSLLSSETAVRLIYHTPYCPCCPQRQLSALFTTRHIVPAVLRDSCPPPSLPHPILSLLFSETAVRRLLYHTPYCPCCSQQQLSAVFTTHHIVPAVLRDSCSPPSLPHPILSLLSSFLPRCSVSRSSSVVRFSSFLMGFSVGSSG